MSKINPNLNPHQLQAVNHAEGPLLILAGAGSGKTSTLTGRVIHLVQQLGVPAWRILAVTFTNKAASEMKQRIESRLPEQETPWISTFHSTCVRILRREITALGFESSFTIYDDQDQERMLKNILKDLDISDKQLKARAAAAAIDAAKNKGQFPHDVAQDDGYNCICWSMSFKIPIWCNTDWCSSCHLCMAICVWLAMTISRSIVGAVPRWVISSVLSAIFPAAPPSVWSKTIAQRGQFLKQREPLSLTMLAVRVKPCGPKIPTVNRSRWKRWPMISKRRVM